MRLDNLKLLFLLVSIFCVGFATGTGLKVAYEATLYKPYEWAENDPPIIVNCYGDDFSELQMTRAISYWTLRGHNIGFYEHSPPDGLCDNDHLWGFIMLRKGGIGDSTTLATTTRRTSGTRIKSAVIRYNPGSQNLDLLNEHELGHALGYSHVEKEGHIMHPRYDKMGSDSSAP